MFFSLICTGKKKPDKLTNNNNLKKSEVQETQYTSSWSTNDEERSLAYRILNQAESFYDAETSVLEKHFYLQNCIEVCYRGRADEDSRLPEAVRACERQITLAPEAAMAFSAKYPYDDGLPAHVGYKQLCIILHEAHTERAIELAKQALDAGSGGDWERRIERMSKHKKAQQ